MLTSHSRIIDNDVEFYKACFQNHADQLRRCEPKEESRIKTLMATAKAAQHALELYRDMLDRKR